MRVVPVRLAGVFRRAPLELRLTTGEVHGEPALTDLALAVHAGYCWLPSSYIAYVFPPQISVSLFQVSTRSPVFISSVGFDT